MAGDEKQGGVVASGDPVGEVRRVPASDRDLGPELREKVLSLTSFDGAQPEAPIDQVEPRLRLGTLIRRARASSGTKLEDVADVLGMSAASIMQIENGNLTLAVEKLQQIATMTGCDLQSLTDASRDFQLALFSDDAAKSVGESMVEGGARVLAMPPEQLYVEFREGWFAGASGRPDPGDMSPAWQEGHEAGRLAMETAFHAKRGELDIHYGDGERGAPA